MRRLPLGMVLMFMTMCIATAGPLEDAETAYLRGDRATTLRILNAQAIQETRQTQSMLGTLFPPCRDRSADYGEVVALFRVDANRGDSRAQFNLGNAYFFGNGVPKDYVEAVKWYRLAAAQGEAGALQNLGYMYQHGKGVLQDDLRAYSLLSLAASNAASAEGNNGATVNKSALIESLENVAAKLTPQELAAARDVAHAWQATRRDQ